MKTIGCVINQDIPRPEKQLVEQFKDIQVANLGDCMSRTAAFSQTIRPMNKVKLLGTAFTVKVPQGDNLMLHKAMDLAQPGDILVIDAGGMTDRAIFGEIMVSYCISRGIAGMIVDGSIRDSELLAEMELPVYAKGISPNGPYKNGPGEIGTIISVGGQVVRPGDIIIGDADGIIAIDPAVAEELLEQVKKIVEKEDEILETIKKSGTYERSWMDEKLKEIGCDGCIEGK